MLVLKRNYTLFSFLCLLYISVTIVGQYVLITPELFYTKFSDQISFEKATDLYDISSKYSLFGIILIPVLYGMKFLLVAAVIQTGVLVENINLKFSNSLRAVMKAEIAYVLLAIVKIFWFLCFQKDYSMDDLNEFSPLSAYWLFSSLDLNSHLKYIFKSLNLFEVAYVVCIASILTKEIKKDLDYCLSFTLKYYGISLVLWLLIISFFSI